MIICNLACIASVPVWFRSKERARKGTFGFDPARNETRATKWKRGRGRGRKEGRKRLQTNPSILKTCVRQRTQRVIGSASRTTLTCVNQRFFFILRGHVWYTTRILISYGCCLFWSARFALQCKSSSFNFFWTGKLFLRLRVSGPHPLPALLLAPFFARSTTLVPRSLLLNRTEMLPTQAICNLNNKFSRWKEKSGIPSQTLKKYINSQNS